MFTEHWDIWVEGPNILESIPINIMEGYSCNLLINPYFLSNSEIRSNSLRLLKFPNNERVSHIPSNIRVSVGGKACIVLQNIPSIKELADVSTNIVSYEKSTAGMILFKFLYIQYVIVENNKFLSFFNHVLELLNRNDVIHIFEGLLLSFYILEDNLSNH